MNRRTFVKSLTSSVALALAAPRLVLPEQPERRIFQLDRTMVGRRPHLFTDVASPYPAMLWPVTGDFTLKINGHISPVATWPPDLLDLTPYPTWSPDD